MQRAPYGVAARGEDLERCDHVQGIEAVEQQNLSVHPAIVGASRPRCQWHTIVVPGRNDVTTDEPAAVLAALRSAFAAGTRIASICSAAFTVAAAGGRRRTGRRPICSAPCIPLCTSTPTCSTSTRARC
ncbi:transcriptional regulator GlxA family with amidase domain [Mycobacterium sp. URHB0021]